MRSVIHRDLKPDNILVSETDQAIIADFGHARHVDEDTAPVHHSRGSESGRKSLRRLSLAEPTRSRGRSVGRIMSVVGSPYVEGGSLGLFSRCGFRGVSPVVRAVCAFDPFSYWQAPEMLMGKPYTFPADIFSYGKAGRAAGSRRAPVLLTRDPSRRHSVL